MSIQEQGKQTDELIEQKREEFFLNLTHSALTQIKLETLEAFARDLRKKPTSILKGNIPQTSFDKFLEIDPKCDTETKKSKTMEIYGKKITQTVNRFWGQEPNLFLIPKERKIAEVCRDLQGAGCNLVSIFDIVNQNFGTEITSSPAAQSPKS